MKFKIVTTFNKHYYNLIAKKMISSFEIFFSNDFSMSAYCEDMDIPKSNKSVRFKDFSLIKDFYKFRDKFNEKEKILRRNKFLGDSFMYDGIRFSKKVFSILYEEKKCTDDFLIWMDCDIVTHKKINISKLDKIVSKQSFISYLGREYISGYSECGFMVFNLKHKKRKIFFNTLKNIYMSGEIYKENQWHDSYIIDIIRNKVLLKKDMINITSIYLNDNIVIDRLNVFDNSYLGRFMQHKKGYKKKL